MTLCLPNAKLKEKLVSPLLSYYNKNKHSWLYRFARYRATLILYQRKVGFFGNLRFSIGKQVKAAPLYGVGLSHRTAEPTEFASFDEL